MNISIWVGFAAAAFLMQWGITRAGFTASLADLHALAIVVGGMSSAMMINCTFAQLGSALARLFALFVPSSLPGVEDAIAEVVRLARKSHTEGGLLAIQQDSRELADGFLHRAVVAAIASGESEETRRIMEAEIREVRVARQEDANVYRTMSVLSPMFGLLGTLLGMIKVLETMSDPTRIGPAMSLALSSAFFGIAIANVVCVPVAGQIRLAAMKETMILELLLEGVLDIAAGKAPYVVEMHMASYSKTRRAELEAAETARPRPATTPEAA